MTLSSLLTSISLIYIKFAKFWYTVNPLKICPLLRGVRYSELIWQRLSHLGLNILFAIQDMSAIGRFHCITCLFTKMFNI